MSRSLTIVLLAWSLAAEANQCENRDLRVATFNVYLNRPHADQLINDLAGGNDPQAKAVAEIIQRVQPDILLLNELDYDSRGQALRLFKKHYLERSQNQQPAVHYPHQFIAPSNTGVASAMDLDQDGTTTGPADAWGYGAFAGQYGMAVLSEYPIDHAKVRTFQHFLWSDMPGNVMPQPFYTAQVRRQMPLSSKSHWDIPIQVAQHTLHLLAAHPTPPIFDGAEDRNGTRNYDEIRLWADYIRGDTSASYLYDDAHNRGGLAANTRFVIAGDYNADPNDGDSRPGAIAQLLEHPGVNARVIPSSLGAAAEAQSEGGKNHHHTGPHEADTVDLNAERAGNLRIDYVLPSEFGLTPVCARVFWPTAEEPERALVGEGEPIVSSDHRMVWVDLRIQQ